MALGDNPAMVLYYLYSRLPELPLYFPPNCSDFMIRELQLELRKHGLSEDPHKQEEKPFLR